MRNFLFLICCLICSIKGTYMGYYMDENSESSVRDDQINNNNNNQYIDSNKEFWENMYQNALLNTKTRYNSLNGDKVCFTCPIDRNTFSSLYHEARDHSGMPESQAPPRVSISWAAQLTENRLIFFCRNNTKKVQGPIYLSSDGDGTGRNSVASSASELEYSCESNRLCLINVKNTYPDTYQCFVRSYVLNVKLNVIVQLQYVLLYFSGDSVKFDYQKEVQVHENSQFTIKCEVPETNPVSSVNAYIDNKKLELTRLDKKTIDNRMSINTYSFEVNATRSMHGKQVKCEAHMKDIPTELANSIDLRSYLSKDYTLSVYYLPICVYPERYYKTGINRSIIIECPINGSNPDVTYYKMIPPSSRTKYELIDNNLETLRKMARFKINPSSAADFGLYECIPRSLAGTAKCDIVVELGATPNPPEQCTVQFAKVNNKTFAQFSCRPGHNQGGASSFLTIYELIDKQLKLSGRVNIDESKVEKEVPYITPADEDKYYEFLIMQENNYGNSTSVILSLGTPQETKTAAMFESKTFFMFGGIAAGVLFVFCVCACCCCSDLFSSSKSDNACCKCCAPSDHMDDEGLTYKKAPMDSDVLVGSSSHGDQPYTYTTDLHKSKGFASINPSTYEYYDNTNTGLLSSIGGHYSRSSYQKNRLIDSQLGLTYNDHNNDDSFTQNYDNQDNDNDDHYMSEKSIGSQRKIIGKSTKESDSEENDNGGGYSDNQDDSMSSDNRQKLIDDQRSSNPIVTSKTLANTNAMFNNNVSVSIGSGTDSIKKHVYLNNTSDQSNSSSKIYKQSTPDTSMTNNNGVRFATNNNYTSIESKNLKYIKTENGLVYTPVTGILTDKNKTYDNSISEVDHENEITVLREYEYDQINPSQEFQLKYKETSRQNSNSIYTNSLKKNSNNNNNNSNNNPNNNSNNKINNSFQNELSMRLKILNKDSNINTSNSDIYSKNYSNSKVSNNPINNSQQHHYNQSEQLSNSTATTSVSSASSCVSNSDLNLKDASKNLAQNDDAFSSNKGYSLLKTTINMNNDPAADQSGHIKTNGTLPKNTRVNSHNGTLNRPSAVNKPPILKPKPRNNNIYQANSHGSRKNQMNTSDSVHNQSIEPLLLNRETSLQTTPSTSVTDVSSTNCTPQHININPIEEIAIKQNHHLKQNGQTLPRSRSNSLTRLNNSQPAQVKQVTNGTVTKATTTFTANGNESSPIYQSVRINNGEVVTSSANSMKTFSNPYDNNTLNKKQINFKKNLATIDDEISSASNTANKTQRTLERRYIKNSEC